MEEITASYSDIKEVTKFIRSLISKVSGIELTEINSKKSINNDIGIDGDDWDDILFPFIEKFNNMDGLLFSDYFYGEGIIGHHFAVFLILFPILALLSIIILPWNESWAKAIWNFSVFKPKPPLYVGDLITTAFVGKFAKRSDYKFILQKKRNSIQSLPIGFERKPIFN